MTMMQAPVLLLILATVSIVILPTLEAFQAQNQVGTTCTRVDRHSSTNVFQSSSTKSNGDATATADDFFHRNEQAINDFCVGTNEFWKGLVIKPVRDYVQIQPAGTSKSDILSKLTAPPEVPGIPRPVWLTILGSVPTALGWYGYYKFSVEEELYQYELQNGKPVSGCGGYGTLFPFVYGVLIGFPLSLVPIPHSDIVLQAAAFWILLGQVNLYRRVNELCTTTTTSAAAAAAEDKSLLVVSLKTTELSDKLKGEAPLYTWWALLPPPLDVVVGLRQVHFLSEFWRIQRGEEYQKDVIAEELFPFISSPRFTLKEFFRTPSNWFWFTKDWNDFDIEILKD
jgi:hypothetical protein